MRIPSQLLETIVDHAREEAPNECCGMVEALDGQALSVHRATNTAASPLRFVIDERELLQVYMGIESAGRELGAIYHSHTRTAPEPSQTDITFGNNWPGVLWIIVGLAGEDVEVRTWRIDEGQASEVELEVE